MAEPPRRTPMTPDGDVPVPPTVRVASGGASAPMAAAGSPEGHVTGDVFCTRCEYNLRTLARTGLCPECGTPVRLSLGNDAMAFALRRVNIGLMWLIVSAALVIVSVTITVVVWIAEAVILFEVLYRVQTMTMMVWAVCTVVGAMLVTTRLVTTIRAELDGALRYAIRISVIAGIALSAMLLDAYHGPVPFIRSTPQPQIAVDITHVISWLAWLAVTLGLIAFLFRLMLTWRPLGRFVVVSCGLLAIVHFGVRVIYASLGVYAEYVWTQAGDDQGFDFLIQFWTIGGWIWIFSGLALTACGLYICVRCRSTIRTVLRNRGEAAGPAA